ncbi:MAG: hypothetical protein ACI91O_001387 [Candidatus Poriferisodalaceae bacterium]|jgi:hypothetical protein
MTVIDESLRTTDNDVIVVNGDTTLAPDEMAMLAIQFDLDESTWLQGSARATATDYGSVPVLVIVAGFTIPLLWIPLIALVTIWLWRRRQQASLLSNQNNGGSDGVTSE